MENAIPRVWGKPTQLLNLLGKVEKEPHFY